MHSPHSHVITITRLHTHFSATNVHLFLRQLFQECNVENDAQFLCKILPYLNKWILSNESLELLKITAFKLAYEKTITRDNLNGTTSDVRLIHWIQQQYKDPLSQADTQFKRSTLIHHIAHYLDLKARVLLASCNRQFYIDIDTYHDSIRTTNGDDDDMNVIDETFDGSERLKCDTSVSASIIAINRILMHLVDDDLIEFRDVLFRLCGMKDKRQFLYYVLDRLASAPLSFLSYNSLEILTNKAIRLAEGQMMMSDNDNKDQNAYNSNNKQAKRLTLYQWVQRRYKDRLCRLPSNLIDHIGSYLNKKESVDFGYLNQQLYIESQKLSYILSRCEDESLIISTYDWKYLGGEDAKAKSWPWAYNFPTHLTFFKPENGSSNNEIIKCVNNVIKSDFFSRLFTRLKCLNCKYYKIGPYIPVHIVTRNARIDLESVTFDFSSCVSYADFDDTMNAFRDAMTLESNKTKNGTGTGKRRIGHLALIFERLSQTQAWAWKSTKSQRVVNNPNKFRHLEIIKAFNGNYRHLELGGTILVINSLDDLFSIFHENLESLILSCSQSAFIFENFEAMKKNYITESNNFNIIDDLRPLKRFRNLCMRYCYWMNDDVIDENDDIFGHIDDFRLRSCINSYEIYFGASSMLTAHMTGADNTGDRDTRFERGMMSTDSLRYLNLLLRNKASATSNLENIHICLEDDIYLHNFITFCLYLIKYKDEILNSFLKLKTIEFDWKHNSNNSFEALKFNGSPCGSIKSYTVESHRIFGYEMSAEYDINVKLIEYECDVGIKSFGILYKNIVHLFDRLVTICKSRQQLKNTLPILRCNLSRQ